MDETWWKFFPQTPQSFPNPLAPWATAGNEKTNGICLGLGVLPTLCAHSHRTANKTIQIKLNEKTKKQNVLRTPENITTISISAFEPSGTPCLQGLF